MADKIKVVVFSGGRGTSSICDAFKRHPQIDLAVVVNAFDDGLSTGQLRRFLPGMLGPSDVRKNISHFIPARDRADQALRRIIEHRLPTATTQAQGRALLAQLGTGQEPSADPALAGAFRCLRLYTARALAGYAAAFLEYYDRQPEACLAGLAFADCSVGNLLFAGCYLASGRDFNRAVTAFADACEIPARIHNVTDGGNAVLVALKADGQFLPDEASIVSPQNDSPLAELFLLPDYLSPQEAAWAAGAGFEELRAFLSTRQLFPRLNPDVKRALAEADIIIYGPGTQHSSLLPSYLTEGLGETIAGNLSAEKIFVSNIAADHEIQGETANSLARKLVHYMNAKGAGGFPVQSLITTALVQTAPPIAECGLRIADLSSDPHSAIRIPQSEGASGGIACDPRAEPFTAVRTVLTDWHDGSGKHAGSRILDELIQTVNSRSRRRIDRFPYLVSVVVPGLNEERTVRDVLLRLTQAPFHDPELKREVIYVDGGSTDRSLEEARSVPGVRVFQLRGTSGRGAALRLGVEKAVGNVIAFFPSDAEYDVADLARAVSVVVDSRERIVFGSRTIKCLNLDRVIRRIYRNNRLGYLLSKYGGLLVSLSTLLLHNRYVSDPFTGIKVFDAATLRGFRLRGRGLNLETEILAKACRGRVFILEIPVRFAPRTRQQGKKTTVWSGLRALGTLFYWGCLRPLAGWLGRGLARLVGRGRGAAATPDHPADEVLSWPISGPEQSAPPAEERSAARKVA